MGFAVDPLGAHAAPYMPSLAEVLIALGLLGIGVLLVTLAAKLLPLAVPEDADVDARAHAPARLDSATVEAG
jgi:Ni/Fe-hydrogenase subunit HybB-like protein